MNQQAKSKIFHYNFFPKNCRGNIPITILVMGVVAICGLAIFSFYISESRTKDTLVSVSLIEKLNSLEDEIYFYENLGKQPTEVMPIFSKEFDIKYTFIFKGEKNNGYSIEGTLKSGDKRILFVKYKLAN